jgi:hypothetical protein
MTGSAPAATSTESTPVPVALFNPRGAVDLASFWENTHCKPLPLDRNQHIDKALARRLYILRYPPVGDTSVPKSSYLVAYDEARQACYPAYLGRATMLFMGTRWYLGFVAYETDTRHNQDPRVDGAWNEMQRGVGAGMRKDLAAAIKYFKAAISEANDGAPDGLSLPQAHFLLAMAYHIQGRGTEMGIQLVDVLRGFETPMPEQDQFGPPPEWIAALRLFYGGQLRAIQ